jgi:hypothetical protein
MFILKRSIKSREASKLIFFENVKMFEQTKSSHLKKIQTSKKFKFEINFKKYSTTLNAKNLKTHENSKKPVKE